MRTYTFFGHSDTPAYVKSLLRTTIIDLIENHGVNSFYVGNHGSFDIMVKSTLKSLSTYYTHIKYAVVLAYLPTGNHNMDDYSDTIYPEGLETSPRRFVICKRNEWMLDHSDIVITYVKRNFGGAAKYKDLAVKRKKTIIELSEAI